MQLNPGERSVLATFTSGPDAEAATRALREAGFIAQMDRIGEFGFRPDLDRVRPAIAGKEPSLVRAVLGPAAFDDDSAILLGASTAASGLSGPISDMPPFLVTLVTTEDRLPEALALLDRHGARY
jgi:hypothetical protein